MDENYLKKFVWSKFARFTNSFEFLKFRIKLLFERWDEFEFVVIQVPILIFIWFNSDRNLIFSLDWCLWGEHQRRKKKRGWKRISAGIEISVIRVPRGEKNPPTWTRRYFLFHFSPLLYSGHSLEKRDWERDKRKEIEPEGVFLNRGKMEENRYSLVVGKLWG